MSATLADRLVIVDRGALVHRQTGTEPGCGSLLHAARRLQVTPNQCLVFKFRPCPVCFPDSDAYRHIVQIGGAA